MKTILRKYFIMGSQNCNSNPLDILQEAIDGGITAFQYREKGKGSLAGKEKIKLGLKLRQLCLEHKIPFFINDDIELADVLNVDGIHIGQDDAPVSEAREKFPNLLIGLSISTEEELAKSPIHLVDYIGAGPAFATHTKEDVKEVAGLEWIRTLKRKHPDIPLVAIGGINETNAADVLAAGADGVSVISAITQAKNIKEIVQRL